MFRSIRRNGSTLAMVAAMTALMVAALAIPDSVPATYYVSPTGNDAAAGTAAAPWKTIAKANTITLAPGDSLLFQGGATFAGTLRPRGTGGTAAAPITIGSYGTGQATIVAGTDFGIYAYNCGGLHIDNLAVVGTSSATAESAMQDGIRLECNAAVTTFAPVSVTRCDVSGFYRSGVMVLQDLPNTAFAASAITGNNLHGNGFSGVYTWGPDTGRLANLYVAANAVHDNAGDGTRTCSGNGIVISGTTGAVVERNVAYANGVGGKGGCGIWGYSSDHLTIQYNVSAHNRTVAQDGDGFDLDDGTSNSVLQYNVASDNDGAGLLMCQWHDVAAFTGNVIRYNVSSGDGRKNGYAGVQLWGRISNCQVYNNTLLIVPSAGNSGVHLSNLTLPTMFMANVAFRDNLICSTGPLTAVNYESAVAAKSTGITFAGNLYHAADGSAPQFAWAGKTYAGLAPFRANSLQEVCTGNPLGSDADPQLAGPLPLQLPAVLPVGMDVAAVAAPVVPAASSPAATAGLTAAAASVAPVTVDLFGTAVPATSTLIGAAIAGAAPTTAPAVVSVPATAPTAPAADAALPGTVIGSAGSYQSAGNTIAKAVDGNVATFFDGPAANGMWVGLDLGSARTVTRIGYAPRVGWVARMLGGAFQVSSSADFTSGVTTLYTITAAPAAGSVTTVTVASPVAARYVRYLAPAGSYGNIAELQLFGLAGGK